MNAVYLIGTVTREPEIRYTKSNLAILELSLAGRTNGFPWYHRATLFGKLAEDAAQAPVGAIVSIAGRLQLDRWQTNDGQKRSMVKVIADDATVGPVLEDAEVDKRGQPIMPDATNVVLFSGNLARDPEGRTVRDGDRVANSAIACNEIRTRRGEREEVVHFVDVSAWRDAAPLLEAGRKGARATVQGRLVTDSWEDRDGNRRFKTKIDIDIVRVDAPQAEPAPVAAGERNLDIDDFPPEEDLPF